MHVCEREERGKGDISNALLYKKKATIFLKFGFLFFCKRNLFFCVGEGE
jgi:hypothetical protein